MQNLRATTSEVVHLNPLQTVHLKTLQTVHSMCYCHIIITTNLGFDKWDQIFTDKVIAAAIVDRLTFKAYIIDMNGPSYRIKATEKWMNERKMKQKPEK